MRRSRLAVLAALAATVPASAEAHLVASGMGPIFDGIAHFALSPEDFLPAIGLAFFAGLRGPAHARAALAALTVAWLAGGLIGFSVAPFPGVTLPAATALLLLAIGGTLAADLALPPFFAAALGAALGSIRGAADMNGTAPGAAPALALLGMTASVFVVFSLAASLTLPLKRMWLIVAARVSGSWLAALGLLFAGWILRYGTAIR